MRRSSNRNVVLGVLLIVLGGLFLLQNLNIIHVYTWWPLIFILIGLGFFLVWVGDRRQTGVLLPAAILVVLGCQFSFLHAEWPIYILAPALGFWLMYFLGEKDVGLLIPAFILTVLALVFWFQDTVLEDLWPILFIIVGLVLLFWRRPEKPTGSGETPTNAATPPGENAPE